MILKKIGLGLGYLGFLGVMTLVFMVMTFPMDRVRQFAEHKLARFLDAPVSIEQLELAGLSGIEIWGFETTLAAPSNGDAEGTKVKPFRLDYLSLETSLIDLAVGNVPPASMEADLLSGQIRGLSLSPGEEGTELELGEISGIRLGPSVGLSKWLPNGMDLEGIVELNGDLLWKDALTQSNGKLNLTITKLVVKNPSFEQQGAQFELTDIDLGSLELGMKLGRKEDFSSLRSLPAPKGSTVIHFESASVSGEDVEVVFDEKSAIVVKEGQGLGDGRLSLRLAFHLTDSFFKKEKEIDGIKETPNSFLKTIMESSPQFTKARKNGFFGVTCKGALKKPDCKLTRPNMRIVGRNKPALPNPEDGSEKGTENVRPPAVDVGPQGEATKLNESDEKPAQRTRPLRKKRSADSRPSPETENEEGDFSSAMERAQMSREERLERVREARERAKAARDARRNSARTGRDEAPESPEPIEEAEEEQESEPEDEEEGEEESEESEEGEEEEAPSNDEAGESPEEELDDENNERT